MTSMFRRIRLWFYSVALFGCATGALRAQIAGDAVTVPVHFQGMFDATATGNVDLPAHINIFALGVVGSSRASYGESAGGTDQMTAAGFARLRPGKTYLFEVDTYSATRLRAKITPPSGYRVFINGVEHEMFDWAMGGGGPLDPVGYFSVRLDDGTGAGVGEAGPLRPTSMLWSVGLGTLKNGKPAGSIRLAEFGVTANAFKPDALYFDHDSKGQNGRYLDDDGEVVVVKVSNVLRQVYATNILADIVVNNDHSYYIRLYPRSQVTDPDPSSTTLPFTVSGTPLYEFLIENPGHPALDSMRVTKTVNQNGALTMWTQLTRQSNPPTGTTQWLVDDWVEKPAGATVVSSPVRYRWTYSDSDRNEHMRIEDGSGKVVQTVFRRFDDLDFGAEISREMSHEIVGANPVVTSTIATGDAEIAGSIRTSYTYHAGFNDASSGNWHKISGISSSDGSWSTYYYCNEFRNRGMVFQLRKPNGDALAADPGPGSSITSGTEITTFSYDFTDNWGTQRLPTRVETRTDNIVTMRSEFSYAYETITDSSASYTVSTDAIMPVVVTTRNDYYNDTQFLTSVTRAYREDADPQYRFFRGMPYSIQRPDKTMSVMLYYRGTIQALQTNPSVSASTNGDARVHVALQGTSDAAMTGATTMASYEALSQALPPNFRIVAGKSMESRTVLDADGLMAFSERRAYVDGSWVSTQQDVLTYINSSWLGSSQRRAGNTGAFWTTVSNTWTAGRLTAAVNETGIRRTFTYDSSGRVWTNTQEGATGAGVTISNQTVTQLYDAAGRILSSSTTAGGETLLSRTDYDTAGRVVAKIAPSQTTATTLAYDVARRSTTVTLPTGATQVQTMLRDGRPKSSTGTAVVGEFYVYAIETDGRRKTTVYMATENDARRQEAWTDWLGRSTERRRPGFKNIADYTETTTYDTVTGQPAVGSRTGYADTRYQYNGMGELVRSGLDLTGGGLDLASTDRISDFDKSIESYSGAYWLTSKISVYYQNNSSATKLVGLTRERLTGLSATLRSETRQWDAENNESRQSVAVDAANKLVTTTMTRPGQANSATTISVSGFTAQSTGFDGLTFSQRYDALGRLQSVVEPRTGTASDRLASDYSLTYHAGTTLPHVRRDASNRVIATTSYDGAGRPIFTQDAATGTSRVSYNALGQVEYQWGSKGYPVSYVYDSYGQRTHLRTYRSAAKTPADWEATAWPGGAVASQDTEWDYDDYSGLLWRKYDASAPNGDSNRKFVEYDYNERGQTSSRKWARTVPVGVNQGQPVTTTYAYFGDLAGEPKTGEVKLISYNDGNTAAVDFRAASGPSYTRLGQATVVQDDTGTRSFTYDATNPWRLTGEVLPAYFGSRTLAALYEESTTTSVTTSPYTYGSHSLGSVKGRNVGYRLGVSPTTASYDLEQTYANTSTARLAGLVTKRASGSSAAQFIYGYEAQSALVKTLEVGSNAFKVTRTYEPYRDLLTQIDTTWGGTPLRASYAYTYNDLRERDTVVQTGGANEAFADLGPTHRRMAYNSRGELISDYGYDGSDATSQSKQLAGRLHDYDYDGLGNRKSSNTSGVTTLRDDYVTNDLNQYTERENNSVVVSGTATAAAKVAVGSPPPAPTGGEVQAGRPAGGTYWGTQVVVNNNLGAVGSPYVGPVTAYGVLPGGGAGGTDLLRRESKALVVAPVVQRFVYDADGNLTCDDLWNYTWDAENRLIRMETTAVAAAAGRLNQLLRFTYDYRGRRVEKSVQKATDPSSLSIRRYIYDDWNVIAEIDGSGALKRSFAWGLDLTGTLGGAGGVGGLLQLYDYDQGKTFFPAYDGNGNIAALVNASTGGVEASYEYSPFGELTSIWGTYATANPFRFSTKWQDDESGLIYYGVRYYSPHEGRFIGRDPIAEQGGFNLYGFCGNDAFNGYDYLGYKNFLSKFWNKFRHTIISTVLSMIPVVGPFLSMAYNMGVGYHYGGVSGAMWSLAGSVGGYTGGIVSIASSAHSLYQTFGRGGNFFTNLRDFGENMLVSAGTQAAIEGGQSAAGGGSFGKGFTGSVQSQYGSAKATFLRAKDYMFGPPSDSDFPQGHASFGELVVLPDDTPATPSGPSYEYDAEVSAAWQRVAEIDRRIQSHEQEYRRQQWESAMRPLRVAAAAGRVVDSAMYAGAMTYSVGTGVAGAGRLANQGLGYLFNTTKGSYGFWSGSGRAVIERLGIGQISETRFGVWISRLVTGGRISEEYGNILFGVASPFYALNAALRVPAVFRAGPYPGLVWAGAEEPVLALMGTTVKTVGP